MKNNNGDKNIELILAKDKARDSTLLIWGVLAIFCAIILGLFIGDLFFNKSYLTEALIHTLIAFPAGWIGHAVVSSLKSEQDNGNSNSNENQEAFYETDTYDGI